MDLKDKGLLVVISAPAGCGKDTVIAELKKADDNVKQSISMTTRAPREGEADGVDYYFTTVENFENNILQDGFLEYVKYGVNYYGTPKKAIEEIDKTIFTIYENRDIMHSCTPSNFSLKRNAILMNYIEK